MNALDRKMLLARLDKALRPTESPYEFLLTYGPGRTVTYRAEKKSGGLLRKVVGRRFAGLGAFVDGRRVA